jgi:acetyl-CoA carboxylase biotin carboxylase subunit
MVYSEADCDAPHVRFGHQAVCIGPAPSSESYLNIEAILTAARSTRADAVHPGYGFLSENAGFARAVRDAGFTFIGPPAEAIEAMGDKTRARALVAQAGVPIVPGLEEPPADEQELAQAIEGLGFPVLVKAAAGGGGKGMRIVRSRQELGSAFGAARREATGAFGDGRLFVERYLERPRHVEVQVLADAHGSVIHLGERECSIQRRHQKIVEEAPSPAVDSELRDRMTAAAVAAARSVGYVNAGTVEFLLGEDRHFYFLEMNTRLQVEHPVTEWVYGVDLVEAQMRIAAGDRLWIDQADVSPRGCAIECRIYAENPAQQFLPSPGRIELLEEPQGPHVRVDSGIEPGYEVPLHYDPMLAKLSVWGADRGAARRNILSALRQYVILGITTTIPFLVDVMQHPAFIRGDTHTHFVDEHFPRWKGAELHLELAAIAAALHATLAPTTRSTSDGRATAHPSPWQTLGAWRLGSRRPS